MSEKKKKKNPAEVPTLPLRHISYEAAVTGAFASVKCTQEFGNDAENPIEAHYVWPLSDEASVTSCIMRIGKRNVEAELKEKEAARKEYQQALASGHRASLLEQERPNIFSMSVGGIEPGEKIFVEVSYVQRIPWQAGGGRFTIPLVVAPQFIPGVLTEEKQSAGGGWSPNTDEVPDASRITPRVAKEGVSYRADISVLFSPGFRCALSSPSHASIIAEQAIAKDESKELKTGDILTDRDFTLVYKSLSRVAEVAVHSGDFKGENFLLANIIPPGDVAPVGSDIVLLLDCSGSMNGPKMAGLKIIGKKIVKDLKNQNVGHKIGIVPFNTRPLPEYPLSEISEATESFIEGLQAKDQTYLGFAFQRAEQLLAGSQRPRVIMMVTDGDTEHGKNWYGNGIRLVAVGIDTAVNDTRIKELTRRNSGTAEFVYPGEDYTEVSNRLAGYLSGPVLRDVNVKADGDVVGVSDVFKGRPATIAVRFFQKFGKVDIEGLNPDSKKQSWVINSTGAKKCDVIAQIWAREFIREKQEEKEQIQTSLKYGVICSRTSFVAVSLKKVPGKKPERVEIPVNLPAGWDYESVFGSGARFIGAVNTGMMSLKVDDSQMRCSIDSLNISGPAKSGGSKISMKPRIPSGPQIPHQVPGQIVFPQPPIAPMPPVPLLITPTKFVPDAQDFVDCAIGILIVLGAGNTSDADKAFAVLKKRLTPSAASLLSDEKKAILKYFLTRLSLYSLRFGTDVLAELSYHETSNIKPWAWLTLKEEGRAPVKKPTIPAGDEAFEYLSWKFGQGEKLVIGEWSLVP